MYGKIVIKTLQQICRKYADEYNVKIERVQLHIYYLEAPNQKGEITVRVRLDSNNTNDIVTNKIIKEVAIKGAKKTVIGSFISGKLENIDFIEKLENILNYFAEEQHTEPKNIQSLIQNTIKENSCETIPRIFNNKTEIKRLKESDIDKII